MTEDPTRRIAALEREKEELVLNLAAQRQIIAELRACGDRLAAAAALWAAHSEKLGEAIKAWREE